MGTENRGSDRLYPDIQYIREQIPIRDVAGALGIRLASRYRAHCFRPERHKHGDANPSLTFHQQKNIARCWVCDDLPMSNLDIMMKAMGYNNVREAAEWIARRFAVPTVGLGKHLRMGRTDWGPGVRAGVGASPLEPIIKSGLWAMLDPGEQAILPVLVDFMDPATSVSVISYRGICRYAGIGSHSTVSKALKRFESLHFLRRAPEWDGCGLREPGAYHFTFDDERFQRLLAELHRRHMEEIDLERAYREEARKQRRAELKAQREAGTCIGKSSVQAA